MPPVFRLYFAYFDLWPSVFRGIMLTNESTLLFTPSKSGTDSIASDPVPCPPRPSRRILYNTKPLMNRLICLSAAGISLFAMSVWAEQPAQGEQTLSFERDIRPIFKTYCLDCHGAEEELAGGLDLRLRRFLVKGGESGPAIEAGNPEQSYLLSRIREGEMPPREKKLSEKDICTIAKWIAAGAPTDWEEPQEIGKGIGITRMDRAFWSFQPIVRPAVPECSMEPRVRTPIDALLLARMKAEGLAFSPDTDQLTLLRRASLDLRGLPPTLDEIARFSADDALNSYERLLDRLLASRHYGERWGRHWLDVAGYADSEGVTEADAVRNFAYKYRDYVVRSFNADKPFDQFTIEQLAGDELVEPPYVDLAPDEIEKLVATGFLRMAADGTGSGASDQEVSRNQVIEDTLKIVSGALLGLTVGCAQCHDHRHDPILQTDYYGMRAIFEPAYDWKNWRIPAARLISLYTEADRAKSAEIEAEAAKVAAERAKKQDEFIAAAVDKELEKFDESLREPYRVAYYTPADQRTDEQKQIFIKNPFLRLHGGNLYQYNQAAADDLKTYDKRMAEIRSGKPYEDHLRVLTEVPGEVPTTFLFHRGDLKQPKDPIAPGGLTVAATEGHRFTIPEKDPSLPTTGRRLAYARWLTSGEHPLVGRVLANRMWMHHLGRGLVETPADFGSMGIKPTNPQVLDWLASEFAHQGWSLKQLHRSIMTSTVYRQASRRDPVKDAIDPDNRFFWRKPIQRLEAEIIRDRILATSGQLNLKMLGPAVPVAEDDVGQIVVASGTEGLRRSVYVQVRRTMPVSMLRQFDMPIMNVNCEKRASSTVSTQSLMLMNSDFILAQAESFARRLRPAAGDDDPRRHVLLAWQLAFSRPPTDRELDFALEFLARQVEHLKAAEPALNEDDKDDEKETKEEGQEVKRLDPELQALTNLCQALMASNEFLHID